LQLTADAGQIRQDQFSIAVETETRQLGLEEIKLVRDNLGCSMAAIVTPSATLALIPSFTP